MATSQGPDLPEVIQQAIERGVILDREDLARKVRYKDRTPIDKWMKRTQAPDPKVRGLLAEALGLSRADLAVVIDRTDIDKPPTAKAQLKDCQAKLAAANQELEHLRAQLQGRR